MVIAAVCGYMAGLIGASNSPISGVGILSVLGISLILAALFPHASGDATKSLVAFALFVTAIIFGVATISNNNLQDLKTGQLGRSDPVAPAGRLDPRRGVRRLVIPPILDLLNTAFTFQGAPGAKATALAAPQAAIISTIAQGVLGGTLDWAMIREGAIIGCRRGGSRRRIEGHIRPTASPAAAGDRDGHLSAARGRPPDPGRRGPRLVL